MSTTTHGTIWWCEVHELNNTVGQPSGCPAALLGMGGTPYQACRMVERRLVSLDVYRAPLDVYHQGIIDGKTEGYDEGYKAGYKAAMEEGDPGGFNGL